MAYQGKILLYYNIQKCPEKQNAHIKRSKGKLSRGDQHFQTTVLNTDMSKHHHSSCDKIYNITDITTDVKQHHVDLVLSHWFYVYFKVTHQKRVMEIVKTNCEFYLVIYPHVKNEFKIRFCARLMCFFIFAKKGSCE